MSRQVNDNLARDPASPGSLTPHERLRELTAILATGIHRLRSIPPASPECGQISGKSSPTGLEAVETTRPDGTGRRLPAGRRVRTQTGRTSETS